MEANNRIGSIVAGLDAEALNQLNNSQADFDGVFQGGGNANVFAAGAGAANALLSGAIIQYMTQLIMENTVAYAAEKLASIQPPDILGMAAQKIASYLISAGDIMKELLLNKDEKNALDVINLRMKLINKINDLVGETIKKVIDKISEKIKPLAEKIESILKYAAQGIVWVDQQLVNLANMIIKSAQKEIDESAAAIQKTLNDMGENIAERFASQQADVINNKIKDSIRKQLMTAQRAIQKAKAKAITNATKAVMQLLATLGI